MISTLLKAHGASVGMHDNPIQQAYADYVERGIECARHHGSGQIFAEAETGTGKTVGYLVAAGMDCVRHRARAIIATHTLALQRQIIDPDSIMDDMRRALSIIESNTGVRLKAAIRIGQRNFVDSERASLAVRRRKELANRYPEDQVAEMAAFERWASANPGAEIREFIEATGRGGLPCGLTIGEVGIDADTDRDSDSWRVYQEHVAAAHDADILVTNHAMLIAHSLYNSGILHRFGDVRGLGTIVVDECDKLEAAARNATSDILPVRSLIRAATSWLQETQTADPILAALDAVHAQMVALFDHPRTMRMEESVLFYDDLDNKAKAALIATLKPVNDMASLYMALPSDGGDSPLAQMQSYLADFVVIYKAIQRANKVDSASKADTEKNPTEKTDIIALRWSPERHYPAFRVFRLYPARVLKSMWSEWVALPSQQAELDMPGAVADASADKADRAARRAHRRATALVLTSATISPPSDNDRMNFVSISMAYGIIAKNNPCHHINEEEQTFSPRKFGHVDIVFSDPSAPAVYLPMDKTTPAPSLAVSGAEDEDDIDEWRVREINPGWVTYTMYAVARARAAGGRILLLTNSYRATRYMAAAARANGWDVIEKTPDITQDACITQFAAQPDGLFIAPGAWEGFDMSRRTGPDGQRLSNPIKHLIISQIPFSAPDGPMEKALYRHLVGRGYTPAKAKAAVFSGLRTAALRKCKQGFGRGIRSLTDRFTLWLTDPRFPRSYAMHRALPPVVGLHTRAEFEMAIPRRFRSRHDPKSAWNVGSVLLRDGQILTHESVTRHRFDEVEA